MSQAITFRFHNIAQREAFRRQLNIPAAGVHRQRIAQPAKPAPSASPFRILFALAFRIAVVVANAMLNAFTLQVDAGTAAVIEGYTGSQPATPETAIGAQVLLFSLTMSVTSFPAAASHLLTASAITDDSSADATGTLAWFRVLTQTGGTAICDGSAGVGTFDMVVNTVAITSGSAVSCSAFTVNLPVA